MIQQSLNRVELPRNDIDAVQIFNILHQRLSCQIDVELFQPNVSLHLGGDMVRTFYTLISIITMLPVLGYFLEIMFK